MSAGRDAAEYAHTGRASTNLLKTCQPLRRLVLLLDLQCAVEAVEEPAWSNPQRRFDDLRLGTISEQYVEQTAGDAAWCLPRDKRAFDDTAVHSLRLRIAGVQQTIDAIGRHAFNCKELLVVSHAIMALVRFG